MLAHGAIVREMDTHNSFFLQLLTGIAYLHSLNLAHRDLKSANVMLSVEGGVKMSTYSSSYCVVPRGRHLIPFILQSISGFVRIFRQDDETMFVDHRSGCLQR